MTIDQREHLDRLIAEGTAAATEGNVSTALRLIDCAWRLAPSNALIGRLLGRLLGLVGRYREAAEHLTKLASRETSAVQEAEIVELLLQSGALNVAITRLGQALNAFAVSADGPLANIAHRLLAAAGDDVVGWVGVGPDLAPFGEVRASFAGCAIDVTRDRQIIRRVRILEGHGDSVQTLRFSPEILIDRDAPIEARIDGRSLIGSPFRLPADFGLDGRATVDKGRVKGWATLAWLGSADFALSFRTETQNPVALPSEVDPLSPSRRTFDFDPDALTGWSGQAIEILASLPDGGQLALPDAPLLLELPPMLAGHRVLSAPKRLRKVWKIRPAVDIVIPVYSAREDTLACLDALIAQPLGDAAIVVVDDASPDAALTATLVALAAEGKITLLRNAENRGFPYAANRGMSLHSDRDIVLLNSDTVVYGNWLARLRDTAYSAADIGTVTAFTNAGSIASYPGGIEQDCDEATAAATDALAAKVNRGLMADIPVGVGHCLYLRRDCIADTGQLDDRVFARGYGEEVDFCLRARQHGWRHVLAADVFIHHRGGASFGKRRAALLERSRRLINLRYPDFQPMIDDFEARDPVAPLRRRLDEARLLQGGQRRHVLLVTHALIGGVTRFVDERRTTWQEKGFAPLILKPVAAGSTTCKVLLPDEPVTDLCYTLPKERRALADLLDGLDIAAIELHHFLDLDPEVIEALVESGLPLDIYVHDYSWICPRVTLIDSSRRYCGEPAIEACENCIAMSGSRLNEDIGVAALRARSARWLATAQRLLVPTQDVADRIQRYFPASRPIVTQWENEVPPHQTVLPARHGGTTKVALIGAVGIHKGYDILLNCARDAAARRLPLEFIVIGYTEDDGPLVETGNVFITGAYQEEELDTLLEREAPDMVVYLSVWPETWCYALTPALRAGLPVAGFSLGAIGERLRKYSRGTVLPFVPNPIELNNDLLRMSVQTADTKWPVPSSATAISRAFASTDRELGLSQIDFRSRLMSTVGNVDASVQILPVSEGLYSFSVKRGKPKRVEHLQHLLLPAVHVGVGPGGAADAVEFISAPETQGVWLADVTDIVIARVTAPTVLLLTSLQLPAAQPLAIEMTKLGAPMLESGPATATSRRFHPEALVPAAMTEMPAGAGTHSKIDLHLRNIGDRSFIDAEWAGKAGRGRWVEAFAITPLGEFADADIEYKGLTSIGLETPWIANGAECGTRGKATPLLGFAIRQRPNGRRDAVECEYYGYFSSGRVVGPLKSGAPCRSDLKNDPLEGLQLRLMKSEATTSEVPPVRESVVVGPRFSRLRESEATETADAPSLEKKAAETKRRSGAKTKGAKAKSAAARDYDHRALTGEAGPDMPEAPAAPPAQVVRTVRRSAAGGRSGYDQRHWDEHK